MSILSKYLLKLHLVPFVFALTAITSIMLLNQIAKRIGDLIGKGLPWSVIVEVFALSIPFLVAMTLPMAVLVTVLYSVSRLAADAELTAWHAGGVSLGRIMRPLILAGIGVTVVAFLFSDQVLPRSNHRLRTLLTDIGRTKPTFSLDEQVINEVQRNRFFLRASQIDQATFDLFDVTIYDLTDNNRKRVIYADSGEMGFAADREDLYLTLYDGSMHESSRNEPHNFQVMNFHTNVIRVEGVAGNFSRTDQDRYKGDREMGICEMDSVITAAKRDMIEAERQAVLIERNSLRGLVGLAPVEPDTAEPSPVHRNLYCQALATVGQWLQPEAAVAQTPQRSATPPRDVDELLASRLNGPGRTAYVTGASPPRVTAARVLRDRANGAKIRAANYLVELHKKYAIAGACLVFVLVGVPVAISFPRAGVGLVIAVSLGVFTLYYVGLIGGESLANDLVVPAFWAMWSPNFLFGTIGVIALWRIRRRTGSARDSGWLNPFRMLRFRRAA